MFNNELINYDLKIGDDPRITPVLDYCIRCKVIQEDEEGNVKDINYKIPLVCTLAGALKVCPACNTVYWLKDIPENGFGVPRIKL